MPQHSKVARRRLCVTEISGIVDDNVSCTWLIIGQNNIIMIFLEFITEPDRDFVRIYDGESTSSPLLLNVSGRPVKNIDIDGLLKDHSRSVVSSTNTMLVVFTSDPKTNSQRVSSYIGFLPRTSLARCWHHPAASFRRQKITNFLIVWLSIGQLVMWSPCRSHHTQVDTSQKNLFLVYDGNCTNSAVLWVKSGHTVPSAVNSTDNSMLILFTSDVAVTKQRFQASFTSVMTDIAITTTTTTTTTTLAPTIIMTNCSYILTTSAGEFQSPNYPNSYYNNLSYSWLIDGQNNVAILFNYCYIEPGHDFVRLYDGNWTSSPLLFEASGDRNCPNLTVSSTNQMLVVFTSDGSVTYRGFEAIYSSCTVLTSASGSFTSPNHTNIYNDTYIACCLIRRPVNHIITLSFGKFWTAFMNVFLVYDGSSFKESHRLLTAYGDTVPKDVTSTANSMLIFSKSEIRFVINKFQATFNSVRVAWFIRMKDVTPLKQCWQ